VHDNEEKEAKRIFTRPVVDYSISPLIRWRLASAAERSLVFKFATTAAADDDVAVIASLLGPVLGSTFYVCTLYCPLQHSLGPRVIESRQSWSTFLSAFYIHYD